MVDVTAKAVTARSATASATVHTSPEVIGLIAVGGLPKGDALATARIAGILAAKRTSDLIPLCHPLALTGVDVEFRVGEDTIELTASVRTADRTGVEMEALTGASIAALTIYDMVKAVDRGATIESLQLIEKRGGRSGEWSRSATE